MTAITIQIASRLAGIPTPAHLRRWLAAAAAGAGAANAQITLRVVNRAEARALNLAYRGRDYATNVLTFAYGGAPMAADIVLCAPVIALVARAQGKAVAAHYAHLTLHGALHAQGFDHARPREATAMEAREIEILGTLGFDNPYVARTAPNSQKGTARRVAHTSAAVRAGRF